VILFALFLCSYSRLDGNVSTACARSHSREEDEGAIKIEGKVRLEQAFLSDDEMRQRAVNSVESWERGRGV
jgi:hypothetical protein